MALTKLSFSNDNNMFIDELREKVKNYFIENKISKNGNASLILKSVLMLLIYILPYIFLLSGNVQSLLVMFFCWLLIGMGMAGLGMVLMHDANHRSFSKNMKMNKWLSKSTYLLGAYPPNWQYQHNTLHHGYTNIDGHDEDIAPIGLLRFSPHKPLRKIHKYQYLYAWFFYCLMTFSWITVKDFKSLYKYRKMNKNLSDSKKFRKSLVELILSKIIYYMVFLIVPLILVPIA